MKKAALITFTSCFGCSFEFLNLRDCLLKMFGSLDFVDFKLVKGRNLESEYDITFVEGGISTRKEVKEVKEIRKRSKILVALGSCACNGCVMTLKNYARKPEEVVYGKNLYGSVPVSGIEKHVNVDYYLRGCPFSRHELLSLVNSVLIGKVWREKTHDVCVECRMREKDCLLDRGILCLGPISRAGCKAICPHNEYPCVGCRGIIEDANLGEFFALLTKKFKMTRKDIKEKLKIYNLYEEIKGSEAWKKLR